jgi:hypothetical protein
MSNTVEFRFGMVRSQLESRQGAPPIAHNTREIRGTVKGQIFGLFCSDPRFPPFLNQPANLSRFDHNSPSYPNAFKHSAPDIAPERPMSSADDPRGLVDVQ